MKTVTVNDSRDGSRVYLLDAETYSGVRDTFTRALLGDVYTLPPDGGVRDDAHWQEEKHKRAKNGQFSGTGGHGGVNEKHFSEKGVGGDHKLAPSDPKSKSLPHGMTVNEYISQKHGGNVGQALSYLKHYQKNGKVAFTEPAKPQPKHEPEVKKTPLTKGKNAEHYNSLGVTMEHELHAKPSMKSVPKGMTVKQYIDQKHGGDEGKALSWLKHYEKNGDLAIKAPGGGAAVQQKLEEPLTGDSTSPVPVSQVKAAVAAKPTPEEKAAAKAEVTAAKAKAAQEAKVLKPYAKYGLTPDHKIAVNNVYNLKSPDAPGYAKGYVHGETLKDNYHIKGDLIPALKHLHKAHQQGLISFVASDAPLPDKPQTTDEYLAKHGDKVIESLKPKKHYYGEDFESSHGKTLNDHFSGVGSSYAKDHKLSNLKTAAQTGEIKIHEPGTKVPSIEESHALHVATLGAEEKRKAEKQQRLGKLKAVQESSFGEAKYDKPTSENLSHSDYMALANQHLKPTGVHHTAMKAYSGSAFSDINSKLRKGQQDQLSHGQRETVKHLSEFMNKSRLQKDMTFFRGMHGQGLNTLHALKPGDDFASGQFSSVSTNKSVAHSFGGGHKHVMVINAKKGARGGFMGSSSNYQNEHEIVLPHDAKLRYKGRSEEGHWIFDHVE